MILECGVEKAKKVNVNENILKKGDSKFRKSDLNKVRVEEKGHGWVDQNVEDDLQHPKNTEQAAEEAPHELEVRSQRVVVGRLAFAGAPKRANEGQRGTTNERSTGIIHCVEGSPLLLADLDLHLSPGVLRQHMLRPRARTVALLCRGGSKHEWVREVGTCFVFLVALRISLT